MKINTRKKHSKKPLLIIGGIIILLAIGGGVFALVRSTQNKTSTTTGTSQTTTTSGDINYSPATTDEQSAGATTKSDAQSTTTTPTTTNSLNVTITTVPSGTPPNETTKIGTLIDVVSSSGTCTLTLTGPTTEAARQTGIQAGPSSSTCEGFNVSDLAAGDWKATILVQIGDKSGSATADFTVK